MKYRWSILGRPTLPAGPESGGQPLPPLLAQCLANRGIADPESMERFLHPRLKDLADPFLLPQMEPAVARLIRARQENEAVTIFGDYDVDGVTSTALLFEFLTALGWRMNCFLPHRFDEGYGLTTEAVENCLKKIPAQLLLAVDCGSTATHTIEALSKKGIDVIILDHHQVSDPPPCAVALVNPQLNRLRETSPDSAARFTELCSVGLAFKLAHALLKRARELGWPSARDFDLRPFLDLVALGTIADIVPLKGENRILVTRGLERLNATSRPGLQALINVSQTKDTIGTYEVGFQLAPRLNAAGRIENAEIALQLLLATDPGEAEKLALALDTHNRERQKIERGMSDELIGALRARFNPQEDFVIVEGQLLWHIGVVGIVASRVLQEFYRPTIIVGGDGTEWRGSGRSIEGFDLAAALRACGDLLVRHGGHAMAAGLTVRSENLDALRIRLNELARNSLTTEQLQPLLKLDSEVALGDLTLDAVTALEQLKPTGPGNPQVQVVVRGLRNQKPPRRVGQQQQHLKLWVTDGHCTVEAVWWNGAERPPEESFDLACHPQINEYNGRKAVQLKILDWRPAVPSNAKTVSSNNQSSSTDSDQM